MLHMKHNHDLPPVNWLHGQEKGGMLKNKNTRGRGKGGGGGGSGPRAQDLISALHCEISQA